MKEYFSFAVTAILLTAVWAANANEGHDHGMEHQQVPPAKGTHGEHGHSEEGAHHRHDSWIDPPEAYADEVGEVWADVDAIARGGKIYLQQCVACHGPDGQGTGPMAESLSHPPADLTNHFHTGPGNGDAYLFWRVSEGGTVEPFKSQGSQMPAFKANLNESERWDVLAYVHTFFHHGLMEWHQSGSADDSDSSSDSGS